MPWAKFCRLGLMSLGGLFLVLTPVTVSQRGITPRLFTVFWNKTSPRFRISNNDHVIDVNSNDQIDLICPKYTQNTPDYMREYYAVYMVKESEYNTCTIYNRTDARLIVNCSAPTEARIFTLFIRAFQGVPYIPDFEPGQTYYFISTSTGHKSGLANQVEGACHKENMKMMLRVCCKSTSTKTLPSNRPLTTSRSPSIRTTPRTTRRTTTRPTTTTTVRRTTSTTTSPTKPPDYDKSKDGPNEKMPEVITDNGPEGRNMGLINISNSTSPQINSLLLTIVLTLLCNFIR